MTAIKLDRRHAKRVAQITGGLIAAIVLTAVLVFLVQGQRTINDLAAQQRKRSPVTDYNNALARTAQCRSQIEDRFLGVQSKFLSVVAGSIVVPRSDTAAQAKAVRDFLASKAELDAGQAALDNIERRCPYPTPPVFDDNGNLITPFEGGVPPDVDLNSTTTTTTTTTPGG